MLYLAYTIYVSDNINAVTIEQGNDLSINSITWPEAFCKVGVAFAWALGIALVLNGWPTIRKK